MPMLQVPEPILPHWARSVGEVPEQPEDKSAQGLEELQVLLQSEESKPPELLFTTQDEPLQPYLGGQVADWVRSLVPSLACRMYGPPPGDPP